jgi:hypothetical protein
MGTEVEQRKTTVTPSFTKTSHRKTRIENGSNPDFIRVYLRLDFVLTIRPLITLSGDFRCSHHGEKVVFDRNFQCAT